MPRRYYASTVVLAFGVAIHLASAAVQVRVTGSENMKGFGERLTQWYARKAPGIQFNVSAARTADAFAALISGKAEVVESARRPLHSEEEALRSAQGTRFLELQVATEIAGIAVNSANPVKDLSLFQLRQVLSGEVKNWKHVGGKDTPIVVYGRDDSSDVRAFLEEEFMGDTGVSNSAKLFATNSALFSALAQDPGGIAFGTVELRPGDKVRFLGIKASDSGEADAPTGEAIRAKRYKLVRPLYFCFAGKPTSEVLHFAQWVISPEGQLVVEAVGYYPLSSSEREAGLQKLSGK